MTRLPKEATDAGESNGLAYARSNRARFVAELIEFVCFASVSAGPKHAREISNCAAWLAAQLRRAGLDRVQVLPTGGAPIVYADWLHAPGRPTVLIYGHYDVQPADPISEWQLPPFEPVVRGDNLFGRGAADDKGQMFTHVKAAECLLRTSACSPSTSNACSRVRRRSAARIPDFVQRHSKALKADVAVLSDTRMLAQIVPSSPSRCVVRSALSWNFAGLRMTCIPAILVDASTIRCRCSAGSSPSCTTATAG